MGYVTSYIVVVKTLTPYLIKRLMQTEEIPVFGNEMLFQMVIATFYTLFILLPFSLPRKIGALRFMSLFGFL